MTKSAPNVEKVFSRVTKPTVTRMGLKEFTAILSDETATQSFFDQDPKSVVSFLDTLSHIPRAITIPNKCATSAP